MDFNEWYFNTWKNRNKRTVYSKKDYMNIGWNANEEAHKPRWIPVSERLPDKENMICAVISENFECPMIRIWMKENWFNVPARLNITHWLELPEMPE